MAAPPNYPGTITFAGAIVRLYYRQDGKVILKWHEEGQQRSTTKPDAPRAVQWANEKARALARAVDGTRMVPGKIAERLDWIDRLAGGQDKVPALLTHLETALQHVQGSAHLLTEAAKWYATHGLATTRALTVTEAKDSFLAEYEAHHPLATVSPIRSELRALAKSHGDLPLMDLDLPVLDAHVRRGGVAKRTIRNRITHLTTFFNRGVALGWWPDGRKPPSLSIKRPRLEDKAPSILTPAQGTKLLAAVRKDRKGRRKDPLPYLLIAGWLGCRPSECLRLDWSDFDWQHRILHVRAEVAGKTSRERWVPMKKELAALLQPLAQESGKVCMQRSVERITEIAREEKIVTAWPPDVLRHSCITYRLGEGSTVDVVAEESGNSPSIIRRDYRRPIPPGVAAGWWACLKKPG